MIDEQTEIHDWIRTNRKGIEGVGMCPKCGKTGMGMKEAMTTECPNPGGIDQETSLLRALGRTN